MEIKEINKNPQIITPVLHHYTECTITCYLYDGKSCTITDIKTIKSHKYSLLFNNIIYWN